MTRIISIIFALALLPGMINGADWPCFNGPNHDNISPDKGLLKKWPESGPSLLFKSDKCGKGYSSVAVVSDTIYTAGDFDEDCKVLAMDLKGNIKWEAVAGSTWTGNYPGSRATPTISDGLVFFMNAQGEINCFDAKDGSVKWTTNTALKQKGRKGGWGYSESLIVDGSNLLCLPGGPEKLMVAFDKKTGKEVWSTKNSIADTASYCTPLIVEHKGKRMIISMSQKNAIGVDSKTGELMWSFPHKTNYDVNAATPVYYKGYVYVSSGYGVGNDCYFISDNGKSVEKKWSTKSMDNHHGGLVGLDGFVYGSGERKWFCIDIQTGEDKWASNGVGKGSLTYADGMLYTLSERGKLGLVDASPKKFNMASSFQVPSEGSSDPFWAHPVVINGVLYVRHADYLFAYNVKAD